MTSQKLSRNVASVFTKILLIFYVGLSSYSYETQVKNTILCNACNLQAMTKIKPNFFGLSAINCLLVYCGISIVINLQTGSPRIVPTSCNLAIWREDI